MNVDLQLTECTSSNVCTGRGGVGERGGRRTRTVSHWKSTKYGCGCVKSPSVVCREGRKGTEGTGKQTGRAVSGMGRAHT